MSELSIGVFWRKGTRAHLCRLIKRIVRDLPNYLRTSIDGSTCFWPTAGDSYCYNIGNDINRSSRSCSSSSSLFQQVSGTVFGFSCGTAAKTRAAMSGRVYGRKQGGPVPALSVSAAVRKFNDSSCTTFRWIWHTGDLTLFLFSEWNLCAIDISHGLV